MDNASVVNDRRPPARLSDDDNMPHAELESGFGVNGLVGNGILGAQGARAVHNRLAQVAYVSSMPLQIQQGFRFKMLAILWLQLGLTLTVSFVVRWAIKVPEDSSTVPSGVNGTSPPTETEMVPAIGLLFPAQSLRALALVLSVFATLPLLGMIKDKHPWNMVVTVAWTFLLGTAIAASQIAGGVRDPLDRPSPPRLVSRTPRFLMPRPPSRVACRPQFVLSNTMSVIFCNIFAGVGIIILLSTNVVFTDEYGQRYLMSFSSAGWIAYVVMLAGTITTGVMIPGMTTHAGHLVGAFLFTSCVFAWICYDAAALCERMVPDEYMQGVIYFYTDFIYVCMCCALLSVFSGGGSQ